MPEGTSTARIGLSGSLRPCIETQNRSFGRSIESAGKAGAEQRVDCEIGSVEINVLDRMNSACPASGGERGVALQTLSRAKQPKVNSKALSREQARGDEAIAAIVARPAKNRDAAMARGKPAASFATAAPACSISKEPGVPPAMVSRSASAISALVSSSMD